MTFINEANITLSGLSRGFFFRHCSENFNETVDLKIYGYEDELVSNDTNKGWLKQNTTSDDNCRILNIRGVKYVVIKILDLRKIKPIILHIAPEHWTMTPASGIVMGSIFFVAGLAAIILANRKGYICVA